jgi:dienelactone hydrolase
MIATAALQSIVTARIPAPVTIVAGFFLAASLALGVYIPVFVLPKPSGQFAIGTLVRSIAAKSESRPEVVVQIWYPVDGAPADRGASYRPYPPSALPWKTSHLALVRTHAITAAIVSARQSQFPVVIFLPSWSGQRGQNMVQVEHLVSNGFVVVGVDHPHGSAITFFADGRIVRETADAVENYSSEESFQAFLRAGEKRVRIRVREVQSVIDAISEWDHREGDPFKGRFDLDRLGVFGHSLGGAVAAEACRVDRRLRAGANLDGMLFGQAAVEGTSTPFLFFTEDVSPRSKSPRDSREGRMSMGLEMHKTAISRSLNRFGGYSVVIRGAGHKNYCDSPLYSPLRILTGAGPIRPDHAFEIINDYLLGFFEKHLCGREVHLLDALSNRFPDVQVNAMAVPASPLSSPTTSH